MDTHFDPADWDIYETGPKNAQHTVLLLPGGSCAARSYAEVMAEPALKDMHLIAATLPGHAGTPAPDDVSVENYARITAELAKDRGCDVVVGFSMGATVALEMVASGLFVGPTVLTGISMSLEDEAAFFRALVRLGAVFGRLPTAALIKLTPMMLRPLQLPPERKAELAADFRRNKSKVIHPLLREYIKYLDRYPEPAKRLCDAEVPTWVVHAEKGDGGLTDDERRTLEACSQATVVTIPGNSFLLPNEKQSEIADVIVEAVAAI